MPDSAFGLRITLRLLACLLPGVALAAPVPPLHSDVLIDEEVTVSPSKVRPLDFDLSSGDTRVLCKFHLVDGRSGVRAVLLKRDDVRLWLSGRAHQALAATEFAESGGFMFYLDDPGAYAIVLGRPRRRHRPSAGDAALRHGRNRPRPARRSAPLAAPDLDFDPALRPGFVLRRLASQTCSGAPLRASAHSRMAATVVLTASSSCAAETKPASNCDGGR